MLLRLRPMMRTRKLSRGDVEAAVVEAAVVAHAVALEMARMKKASR